VDVEVALAVSLPGVRFVDVAEPVVRDDLAGGVEDEPPERVPLVGVGVDPPVAPVQVLLDGRCDVDDGLGVLDCGGGHIRAPLLK